MERNIYKIGKELYITSDEEIKEDDYRMNVQRSYFKKSDKEGLEYYNKRNDVFKKIILTTDEKLINDGVQAIDDDFIKWFINNSSCEHVEVANEKIMIGWQPDYSYEHIGIDGSKEVYQDFYKISIPKEELSKDEIDKFFIDMVLNPKEEPKQETLKEQIVGYRLKPHIDRVMIDSILKNTMPIWNDNDKSVYFIRGHVAGSLVAKLKELQVLDLWFMPIYESEEVESDWVKEHHLEYYYEKGIMSDKSKQETLEEAMNQEGYIESDYDKIWRDGVEFGSKWQAERMYSEEEVIYIFKEWEEFNIVQDSFDGQDDLTFIEWFKQFKNK